MNFNNGKLYAIIFCIVPAILQASDQNIDRLTAYLHPAIANKIRSEASEKRQPAIPSGRPVNSPATVQQIRNLSDVMAKKSITKVLDNVTRQLTIPEQTDTPLGSSIKAKNIKKIFQGDLGGHSNQVTFPYYQASLCRKIIHNSLPKPVLIRDTNEPKEEKINEQKKERIDDIYKKRIKEIKTKGLILKTSVISTIIAARLLETQQEQSRFGGILAATSIISVMPTILTCICGVYGIYKIDQMLHAEERVAIRLLENRINKKLEEETKGRIKALELEKAERIKADSQEKKERIKADQETLAQIENATTEVRDTLTGALEEYHKSQKILNDSITTIKTVKDASNLLVEECSKITPKVNEILQHTARMRENAEDCCRQHQGSDGLDHELYNLNIPKDFSDEEEEEKSEQAPSTAQIKKGSPSHLNKTPVNSNEFQDQFRKKNKKSSPGIIMEKLAGAFGLGHHVEHKADK